ncbi:hypothetical protein DFR28_10790 [Arenicella xantha]|uniref:Uncharacterized protein n=1 Tax=Arenicella xantha TaxID=644221 RepID=A0A395JFK1_9GAMM|nr:hypothetical protein DFR28_10790 [Arenicella xantha]
MLQKLLRMLRFWLARSIDLASQMVPFLGIVLYSGRPAVD